MTEKLSRKLSSNSLSSTETTEELQVNLRDCEKLIRNKVVGLPGGFTKSGHPLIIFPDNYRWFEVLETELHLLLKYYCHIIPRAEQISGFAILIDRRNTTWQELTSVFYKVVSQFPADIKEVFLLYKYPSGKPMLGQLVDTDYLLDFDIFHVSQVTELLHYVDGKYLTCELGGSNTGHVDTWISTQYHVDNFTVSATQIAKKLAEFIAVLNKEDVSRLKCQDQIIEIAERNRKNYRKLRQELEELTDAGVVMLHKFEDDKGTVMQKLAIQMLCYQLDTTWQFFTRTFKMQNHLYVQYVEITVFQTEYLQVCTKFKDNENILLDIPVSGSNLEEVNAQLDKLEALMEGIAVDVHRARRLTKAGMELMSEYVFTKDILEPKCQELKSLCKKQEVMFTQKRQTLIKFLDLFQTLDFISKWRSAANQHLSVMNSIITPEDSSVSLKELRQLEYLLKKLDEVKIKTIFEFEEEFDSIRDLISPKTLFNVDDNLNAMHEIKRKLLHRIDYLVEKEHKITDDPDEIVKRRMNILDELLSTETKYVQDIESILSGYKDVLENSFIGFKSGDIFGNLEEVHQLHSESLLPKLFDCGANIQTLAKVFIDHCPEICKQYRRYCQNIENARRAISEIGENHPAIIKCQRDLSHQLPLSSYLLKPVQRLTKYQLLLKDLLGTCISTNQVGRIDLQDSLAAMLRVIRTVNDSLHQVNITHLPSLLNPLGSLICQETFTVVTENKSQSQILFCNRAQTRHVLLYDNYLIFCRVSEAGPSERVSSRVSYQYKFSLPVSNVSMITDLDGEEDQNKLELRTSGNNDVYILEARDVRSKEDFCYELSKLLDDKEDDTISVSSRQVPNFPSQSSNDLIQSKRLRFTRSKSLETRSSKSVQRSRSLDNDDSDEASDKDYETIENKPPQYKVLADYSAPVNSHRELSLVQDEVVTLMKIGCAGWWFVRKNSSPEKEGWAPSTYLQLIPGNTKTLDRK